MTKDQISQTGLVITVTGLPNRGKTTVARLIEETLRTEGFEKVYVKDIDETPDKENIQLRVQATKKRPVFIEVQQANRVPTMSIKPGEIPMSED